jgi:hypothetical protein
MGLSSGEAELLFRADNSANRIQWIAQDIAEAHGYELTLV